MGDREKVRELLKCNNGVIKTKQVSDMGVDKKILTRMVEEGLIERVSRGIYIDSDQIEDEYYIFQKKCPKAVFSHSTALYFHDLSDRTPLKFMVTVPSGYYTRLLKDKKYVFSYIKDELYELGIIKVKTIFQNEVYCYDIERTICDIVRNSEKVDKFILVEALKRYVRRKDNNYEKLYEYAEKFNVKEEIVKYMEVLI